jgi:hypothetical protein
MKWLAKILLFIFTMMFITVGESKSSTAINILQKEILYSFYQKSQSSIVAFENHSANSCIKGKNEVIYGERDKGVTENAAKGGMNALVKTGTQFSKHSLERLAQRGVTQDMAELVISKGQKFYDPLNKSINYVLLNGFASGKSLLVGTNPLTGEVTTVLRSSKNLIKPRMVPIP